MFTHLHVHTEYSLLDGMGQIPKLIAKAKEMGMNSLAISDHGALYGILQFYTEAKKAGIKPILGCEFYMAPRDRFSKDPAEKRAYHLLALAKNEAGYHNLLQLSSKSFLEGFYYKPRIDREILAQHSEGLIVSSACLQGEIPQLILQNRLDEAEASAMWHKEVFGNDFYLEMMDHGIPEQKQVNRALMVMSRKLDIPLIATNDAHYVNRDDAPFHDLLLCIQTNSTIHDEKRMKLSSDDFYLKSEQEMAAIFSECPEAISNTAKIAEMCELKLEFGRLHLPKIDIPEGKTPDEYLADLCWEGLERLYPDASEKIRDRMAYELDVIKQTEFPNYFLVSWELTSFVRKQDILFGVRGSAAASIVLYCLGITDIEPMQHNLVFERFLNVERKEMPDIDFDFQDDRREEVIQYVAERYGADHVAQIITFGTLGARAALRDVGRALGMPYSDVDAVTKLVPAMGSSLSQTIEDVPEFAQMYRSNGPIKKLVDSAMRVEGLARHASTHAAGVVIANEPLANHVALQRATGANAESGIPTTQINMEEVGKVGLLKLDFLGLANLTILGNARKLIKQTRGIDIDIHHLPLDDAKTFELLSAGETTGVFQLEGGGMRRHIKELKPTTFSDIASMVALYRPGPKQHIPAFIESKHGKREVKFPHPALEEILRETYGIIVYQDQVLLIVQTFAGYTLGQADIVRKAMGKKKVEIMQEERQKFVAGAMEKKGFSKEMAEEVFDLIEPFAGYAFNKAHATSYGMVAYQTAYLKANYPAEFMTALLMTNMGNHEKIANAASECRRLGIKILPPDVNRSKQNFSIEKQEDETLAIRFGLAAIKNVGEAAIEPIIAEQEKAGPFQSIEDFARRTDLRGLNKRALEGLIKVGALDSLGTRGSMLAGMDRILRLSQQEHELKESGQTTMFDLWGESASAPLPQLELDAIEVPESEVLGWEKELLGIYVSAHPLESAAKDMQGKVTGLCSEIHEMASNGDIAGQEITVAGAVASARRGLTRNNKPFVSAVLEDISGEIEVTAWSEVLEGTEHLWEEGSTLLLCGKIQNRGNRIQLVCKDVVTYETGMDVPWTTTPLAPPVRRSYQLTITLHQTEDEEGDNAKLDEIFTALKAVPGEDKTFLSIANGIGTVNMELPDHGISYSDAIRDKLQQVVGEDGVTLKEIIQPAESENGG